MLTNKIILKRMGGDRSIQVLNISNVNAQGKTVLNDGKLLELIQKYPFLYNKRVKGYNDYHYIQWAWKNINAAFNSLYANDPTAAFSTGCIMSRWEALKPLIQCLSKAYDMEAIPQSLRNSVIRICNELEDKRCNPEIKQYNSAQHILLRNMSNIDELPQDKKLALEREILDVILSAEWESKKMTALKDEELKEIQQETDEFITHIGYKQVLLTAITSREKIFYNNYCNRYQKQKILSRGWIPLEKAHKVIKPCRVRLRSINIEEYLPLSQIIQMNKMKHHDLKSIAKVKSEFPSTF